MHMAQGCCYLLGRRLEIHLPPAAVIDDGNCGKERRKADDGGEGGE